MKHFATFAAAIPFASLLALAGAAGAQEEGGFALNQLKATPAGDTFLSVPSPFAAGHLELRGHAMFDYARHPIRQSSDDVAVVEAQGYVRGDLSLALWDRLLISADMPLSVVQSTGDATASAATYTALDAPQAGDLRFGARGRLYGENLDVFQLGVGSYLYLPTGNAEQYTGEGAVRGAFHASAGGRFGPNYLGFLWNAAGGVELRGSDSPQAITYGAAVAVSLADDMVQVGPEFHGVTAMGGQVALSSDPVIRPAAGTNAELLIAAKARFFDGLTLGVGAGPGLFTAIGTPTMRAVALVGWSPAPKRPSGTVDDGKPKTIDRDDDGTPDEIDACPDEPGEPSPDPAKDGCPPPDRDEDGVLDMEDACPGTPGERSGDATQNGCPVDTDGDTYHDGIDACPKIAGGPSDEPTKVGCPSDSDDDGVPDSEDGCPEAAGEASDNPDHSGCPADPDGDGILYRADACPFEKGDVHPDPKQNGCPKFVRVRKGEIVISQKVEFDTYGDSVKEAVSADSEQMLREVVEVINQHSEIELLEVQGHTDDSGNEEFNLELSERRAKAVLKWLSNNGVDGKRLTSKGYGFSRPIADNRVRTGRQRNRRVQFVIIKQSKK